MPRQARPSPIVTAAQRLREMSLASPPGQRLGGEDEVLERLAVSRGTLRQAARLLEREGLLLVRRGPSGGYYGGRPDVATVEAVMSTYLHGLGMEAGDVTTVASALWVEALRKAAASAADRPAAFAAVLEKLTALGRHTPAAAIWAIDAEIREAVFALGDCRYIALIFRINLAFAEQHFPPPLEPAGATAQTRFVARWRAAKLIEIGAVVDGDGELAAMAGRHGRAVWDSYISGRYRRE